MVRLNISQSRLLALIVIGLLFPGGAMGDSVETSEGQANASTEPVLNGVEELPEMLVRRNARRDGRPVGSDRQFTELTRDVFEIRPNTRRLGDVIGRMPGVFMGGPPNENKDIRLRGLDKEFTRFEFGGIQLPGAGEKREFQVNRLSPLYAGSIRIIRNSTAEYESDGIAGRVIVEPRPIPETWAVDLHGGLGGIDTIDGEQIEGGIYAGTMLTEQFGFNAIVDFSRLPLEKTKTKQVFKDGSLKLTESEDEDKPTDSYNLFLDTVFRYSSGEFHFKPLYIELSEEKDKSKLKSEVGKDPELENEVEDKEQSTWGIAIANEHYFENGWFLESELGYYKTSETKDVIKPKFKDKGGGFELDKTELEDEDKADEFYEFKTKLAIPHEWLTPSEFKTGFHVRVRDRFRKKDVFEVKPGELPKRKSDAKDNYWLDETLVMGFVQNEFFITEQLSIMPGVRIEHTILDATSGAGDTESRSFTDVNPSLHMMYRVNQNFTVSGAISRSLNRPKFDELAPFVNERGDRFVEGNPDLDPARSWNFDVTVSYEIPGLYLAASPFYKSITDVLEEIDTGEDRDGKDIFRIENVGDGYLYGIELEQRIDLGTLIHPDLTGLNIWANETLIDSELEDQFGDKRPFKDQPELIANFGLDYTFAPTRTTMSVAVNYRSELVNIQSNDERESEKEAWSIDIGLRQRIGEHATLVFEVINVTDSKKEKTKIKGNEVEFENESTGRIFFIGFEATF